MKKIFLLVFTCTVSYLALATDCDTSHYCQGGQRMCCVQSNGDTYYDGASNETIE